MYELAVGIKMLHMTFSTSHNSSLINYYKILLIGVRTSRRDQNAPHDFLYIPQLWDTCTACVHATADLQIYL